MDPSRPKPAAPGIGPGSAPGSAPAKTQGPSPAQLLAKMPRRPLTVEQQAVALEKVQQQATQRVKLGQQLFEAADARLKQHQQVLDDINNQQTILREQVQDDVAKSLQSYDQWMGRIDESFTQSIRDINQRLDRLEGTVSNSQHEMQDMLAKAAALLGQTQTLVAQTFDNADELAQAMQASADKSHGYDLDELTQGITPDLMDKPTPHRDAEVLEVDIVAPHDNQGMPAEIDKQPPAEGDDVFGQVLRRLRLEGDDGNAAA